MITKFEKRVLAFLLAGLLCVPVTAVPSVTANAEEAESTAQQDDQQPIEEDVQTSTSETQEGAKEQQLTTGNQENGSSGGEAGDDLSDGAFIPIEEEQDEIQQDGEQEVNENKEIQTENLQEEEEEKKAAAQKTATNNLSDEELEEVTLGEDGEPVRMTTEISESEEAVRYLFQPQESGAYYIDLLGTGNFSVYEKNEDGYEQWIDSASSNEYEYGSEVFELEAGTTYYIDISYDYSGTAGVVSWKLGRPQDITPGEYEAVISEPGERAHYHLIYGESDMYYFEIDGSTGAYFKLDDGDSSSTFSFSSYEKVNKDNEYYIDVFFYNDFSATGNVRWSVSEVNVQTVAEGERIYVPANSDGDDVMYSFIPQTEGTYAISSDSTSVNMQICDEYMSWVGDKQARLKERTTYYIKIHDYSGNSFSWSINKAEECEILENETNYTAADSNIYYKFVPEVNGIYYISSFSATIYDVDWNTLSNDQWFRLSAGQTYYIVISSTWDTDWKIMKAEETMISAGELIHTKAGEADYYKFVPTESGKYSISSYYAALYDADWNRDYGERYDLVAGETYYIVITSGLDVDWTIKIPQEITINVDEIIHTITAETDYYKFIPTESGWYSVSTNDATLYDGDWDIIYGQRYQLEAGKTYYIEIKSSSDIDWNISKVEEIEITSGQIYRVSAGKGVWFKFVPEESCEYSISNWLNVYDSEWNRIYNNNLAEGETYYFTPSSTSLSFYFSIEKREAVETKEIEIQSGEAYTTPSDQQIIYTFVPKISGRYHFRTEQTAYIDISNGTDQNSGYIDYWISLVAGVEYEIGIRNRSDESAVHWSVQNVELISIEEGQEIVTEASISQEYEFVPQTSGYYLLASDDQGRCTVYDNEWSRMYVSSNTTDMYDYIDENGFGVNIYMEEGQPYYFDIVPGGDTATWQINPIEESGDYRYRILPNGTVEILNYLGNATSVDIPKSIDGKAVGSIGYGAFSENDHIESVTIPGTVTELQYGAFLSCSSLQNVTLAEDSTLQSIGNMAFRYCSSLTDINLPDSVEKIESQAFYNCSSLGEVNLGAQLEEIGNSSFYNTGLTELSLPDSLTTLGDNVFGSCGSLEKITLGKGLKGIEAGTFSSCESLAEIEIPENITYISDRAFSGTALTRVDIPNTVTSVGNSAFAYCSKLQEVNIGSNVTYIADGVFSGCDLRVLTINGEVESIGNSAFFNNKNLESIEIPSSVTRIEYRAFSGCDSLLEIEIPDSVEAIAGFAFDSTNNNANTAWYDKQEDGVVYAGKVLYKYKGTAPEGTTITIDDGTKGIAGYAFYWQYNLKEIQLPNTVTNIGDYAFYGCESMTEIHIPQSVTEIGKQALGYLDSSGIKVPGFTIYGVAGSAAQVYAEENGFTFLEVEPEYTLGDVDASGKVDIADLRMVLRSVCGKVTLTSEQKLAADVEKDNTVDIQDLRKLLRFVCGKIDEL